MRQTHASGNRLSNAPIIVSSSYWRNGGRAAVSKLKRDLARMENTAQPPVAKLQLNPDGSLVELEAGDWFVCFVPGIDAVVASVCSQAPQARLRHAAGRKLQMDAFRAVVDKAAHSDHHDRAGGKILALGRAGRRVAGARIDSGRRWPSSRLDELRCACGLSARAPVLGMDAACPIPAAAARTECLPRRCFRIVEPRSVEAWHGAIARDRRVR